MPKRLLIIFFAIFPCIAFCSVEQNNDFQLWLYNSFNKKLHPKYTFYLDGEIRYGDNASTLYLFYLQTRLSYALCKNLTIFPGYRQLYFLRVSDRTWRALYEPFFDATVSFEKNKWEIINRNRLSYLFFEDGPDLWQYRNRIMVKTPWKLGKMRFNPLVFDEMFFRETHGFFENRFGLGGDIPFCKNNQATVLYMLRVREFADGWRRSHILWLQLNISF